MATELDIVNRALSRLGANRITSGQFATPDNKESRAVVSAWSLVRDEVMRAASWNSITKRVTLSELAGRVITSVSAANPPVLVSTAHGFILHQRVRIQDVVTATYLNGNHYRVGAPVNVNDFTLVDASTLLPFAGTPAGTNGQVRLVPDWDWDHLYALPSDSLRVLAIDGQQDGDDWLVENGFILADFASPIHIRYLTQELDETKYDPLLVSALAARLAAELCEELTQSSRKRDLAWAEYQQHLRTALSVDGREQTPEEPEETPWISVRF